MISTPNTELYLLSHVHLDPEYKYTIDFDNETLQQEYFQGKISTVALPQTEYSFVRENETIKVQRNIEELESVNYLMYKNDNKWHYCFITRKEYVNPYVTRLFVKYDVFQSKMFEFTLDESFIDREHQDRFSSTLLYPIYNLQDENLDYGKDYVIQKSTKLKDTSNDEVDMYWIALITSQPVTSQSSYSSSDPTTWENFSFSLSSFGRNTGLYCYLLPVNRNNHNTQFFVVDYNGNDKDVESGSFFGNYSASTAIISARVLPYCPIKYSLEKISDNNFRIIFEDGWQKSQLLQRDVRNKYVKLGNNNFGGVDLSRYSDRIIQLANINAENEKSIIGKIERLHENRPVDFDIEKDAIFITDPKVRIFPYYFYSINDYKTEPLIVKNEHIDADKDIKIKQSTGASQKSKIYVDGYLRDNGKEYNSINNGVEELPLKTNAYASFLASSKASATAGIALNVASSILQAGVGIATGGVGLALGVGKGLSIGGEILNNLIKKEDLKNTPDNVRKNGNNIEFDIDDDNLHYCIVVKRCERPYLLNRYFIHYGYKCNEFKVPDYRSRYYFNYIRTIGANIKTNIDAELKNELQNIFDTGLTIWHYRDASTFKGVNNYKYQNCEMSLL